MLIGWRPRETTQRFRAQTPRNGEGREHVRRASHGKGLAVGMGFWLLGLGGLAVLGSSSTATAQGFGPGEPSPDRPESLWLADGGGVVEVSRTGAEVLSQVPDSRDARALALDLQRELLWHASNGSLSLLPLTGDPGLSLPLRLEDGQRVFLERFPR